MKKLAVLLVILAAVVGLSVIPAMGVEIKSPQQIGEEIKLTIQREPISIFTYAEMGVDFVTEIFNKILKSGKPVVLFSGGIKAGLEVDLIEHDVVNMVLGVILLETNGMPEEPTEENVEDWFIGVESKGIPFLSGGSGVFKNINLSLSYYRERICVGFSYEFR